MMCARLFRIIAVLCSLVLLSGCGWNPLSFFSSKKDEEQPAKLVDIDDAISIRRQWNVNVGNGQGDKFNRLRPVIVGDNIYVASNNGVVMVLDRASGKSLWREKLDYQITGGVGGDEDLVLVGTENSSVIALNARSGDVLWETEVSSEVLSAPGTNGEVVVVQSIDGKLTGLDADTGEELWLYESTVPALTLRGTSSPLVIEDFVICAFANGTVASIAMDIGTLRWEERVAIPTGTSEIDRMVDIDGNLLVTDAGLLVVPSFQGYLAAIDVVTGQTRWRVQESSVNGATSGFGNIYISDARDHVKAYRTNQEEAVWSNDLLDLRGITAPQSFNNYVAVSDFEGYVHFISQVDGRLVGRTRVDRGGVRSAMIARGNMLYVYGNNGNLSALTIQQ
jgi:outer membrane protein assembly factor BamB